MSAIGRFTHYGYLAAKCAVNYPAYLAARRRDPRIAANPHVPRNFFYSKAIIDFLSVGGDEELLLKCPLEPGETVMDVGGYNGEWARAIRDRYQARMHIFEPSPVALGDLELAFKGDSDVTLHPYGLSDSDSDAQICVAGMGSSTSPDSPANLMGGQGDTAPIRLRDVCQVLDELGAQDIGLLKVNIEGGEYPLFDRLIETGLLSRFRIIRVQFHEWVQNAEAMRKRIQKTLAETHDVEWDYPFVWESWIRKKDR